MRALARAFLEPFGLWPVALGFGPPGVFDLKPPYSFERLLPDFFGLRPPEDFGLARAGVYWPAGQESSS